MWSVDQFKDEFKLSILEDNPKPSIRVISLGAGVQSSTMMFLAYDGVIKDVSVTSDCDLMLEVKDINTKETKIIFSHNVLETER